MFRIGTMSPWRRKLPGLWSWLSEDATVQLTLVLVRKLVQRRNSKWEMVF